MCKLSIEFRAAPKVNVEQLPQNRPLTITWISEIIVCHFGPQPPVPMLKTPCPLINLIQKFLAINYDSAPPLRPKLGRFQYCFLDLCRSLLLECGQGCI